LGTRQRRSFPTWHWYWFNLQKIEHERVLKLNLTIQRMIRK
jgi:hypothetical protein